jgi:Na+-driven multidrug efflux pump
MLFTTLLEKRKITPVFIGVSERRGKLSVKLGTKVNILAFWMIEIPLAWFLATRTTLAENGVFYTIIFAEACMTMVSIILFRMGRWKKESV